MEFRNDLDDDFNLSGAAEATKVHRKRWSNVISTIVYKYVAWLTNSVLLAFYVVITVSQIIIFPELDFFQKYLIMISLEK